MGKEVKQTDYKTKRINSYTGGIIGIYQIEEMPSEEGIMYNQFLTKKNEYIGDYSDAWWYFRNNLLVCLDKPHGLAINLKEPANKYPHIETYIETGEIVDYEYVEGYYGFSHRGGSLFKIGDRLFDSKYKPKKEDYPEEVWGEYLKKYDEYVESEIKKGYYKTEDEARQGLPLSDVISFSDRGGKIIETWDEAKQAAINMSSYLS